MKGTKILILILILTLFIPIQTMASSLEKLPASETSTQWEVVIDHPESDEVKPKPGVYNMYSMDIKYVGDENIKLVRVEAYRDEPNSPIEYELFTADYEEMDGNFEPSFHHQNFPFSAQAKKLKVIITWKKDRNNSRSFRDVFVFSQ
ncbi:hypothetical protein CFK37_18175 [Virgibacillus phasianinus]|uniref:Uncharacterized protein n=1 Tax=Virgibacillus phasianinus TaxID=2017483 RepID=A0A220U748_9BACI|nr:hypothetical protein [Virgibacillus phasianinus]ASK63947.1 hypothetical protein CFK37_18175 [Virgibacillus phasianinus]